jgi:hypothetical protein
MAMENVSLVVANVNLGMEEKTAVKELAHYYVEVMEITKMENVNAILDGRAKNAASDMTSAKWQIVQAVVDAKKANVSA